MRVLSSTLTQAQKDGGDAIWKAVFIKSGQTTRGSSFDTTNRLLDVQQIEEGLKQSADVVIDNRDGNLTSLDLRGYQVVVSYGYHTTVTRSAWVANTAYSVENVVIPTTANGYQYICTTAGTSHAATEPTWTTSLGVTNTDGTVTWTMDGNSGDEYSATAPLTALSREHISYPYEAKASYSCIGKGNQMMEDVASADYLPLSSNTDTVKTLIAAIAGATMAAFNHCTAITLSWDSEDSLIDSFAPADGFRVLYGENRLAKIQQLLSWTRCVGRFESDGKLHIRRLVSGQATAWVANTAYVLGETVKPTTDNNHIYECTTAGTSHATTEPTWTTTEGGTNSDGTVTWTLRYDYSYNDLGTATTQHTFWQDGHRSRLVLPNKVTVESDTNHSPAYTGTYTDSDSNALLDVRDFKRTRLASNAQAAALAKALVTNLQRQAERGWGYAPMNVGQEVYDLIRVTDNRTGAVQIGNVGYIRRRASPWTQDKRTEFSMSFRLGEPSVGIAMGASPSDTWQTFLGPRTIDDLAVGINNLNARLYQLATQVNAIVEYFQANGVDFKGWITKLHVTSRLRIPVGSDMFD